MSVSSGQVDPAVRRMIFATCVIALLPITMGSLVTTLHAGMAFLDWPSSDGQNMLLYPWLQDLRTNPQKFVEHGHRLFGVVIGICSILLVLVVWRRDQRRWVRAMSVAILVAVVLQGLLGGARVLMNRQTLAMVHSITGALFFCLCLLFRTLTGVRWNAMRSQPEQTLSTATAGIILFLPVLILGQYVLGSAFRHLHTMLWEHIGGAVITGLAAAAASVFLMRSNNRGLVRSGRMLMAAMLLQVMLGLSAYVTRLGFQTWGIVAVEGSIQQAVFCSLHTVGGMLLLAAGTVASAGVFELLRQGQLRSCGPLNLTSPALPGDGGVA